MSAEGHPRAQHHGAPLASAPGRAGASLLKQLALQLACLSQKTLEFVLSHVMPQEEG